jgi:hypothetical protein
MNSKISIVILMQLFGSLGLAMSRAFGDFCIIDYGLNAAPDVFYRKENYHAMMVEFFRIVRGVKGLQ